MKKLAQLLSISFVWLILFLQGCSSTGSTTVDVAPIATETGELVAKIEFGLKPVQPVLLIRYVDTEELPAVQAYGDSWNELLSSLRGVIRYSLVLIEITEDLESAESREVLARNVETLYAELRAQPSLESDLAAVDIEAIATQIRSAEEFIDAARASQQAVDPAVGALDDLVNRTARQLDFAVDELLLAIDAYHADVVRFQDVIALQRNETIRLLESLDKVTRTGDVGLWDEFRSSDRYLKIRLEGLSEPTPDATDQAVAILLKTLENLGKIEDSLGPSFELYQAEVLELREVAQSIDQSLSVARVTVQAWDRGHKLFVSGRKTGFALYTSLLMNFAMEQAKSALARKAGL